MAKELNNQPSDPEQIKAIAFGKIIGACSPELISNGAFARLEDQFEKIFPEYSNDATLAFIDIMEKKNDLLF